MKQSVTRYSLESVKRFSVCPEEPSYLNTLLLYKRTLREKAVVVVRNVVPCIRIFMYFNKDDHEFHFLLALSGGEWHILYC